MYAKLKVQIKFNVVISEEFAVSKEVKQGNALF